MTLVVVVVGSLCLLCYCESSCLCLNHPSQSLTFDFNETIYNRTFYKYRSVLVTKVLIIIGLVIVILGVIFLLQSKTSLGPSTSFMYSNPEWTVNGYIIIAMGVIVIVIGVGVITRQYSKKHI